MLVRRDATIPDDSLIPGDGLNDTPTIRRAARSCHCPQFDEQPYPTLEFQERQNLRQEATKFPRWLKHLDHIKPNDLPPHSYLFLLNQSSDLHSQAIKYQIDTTPTLPLPSVVMTFFRISRSKIAATPRPQGRAQASQMTPEQALSALLETTTKASRRPGPWINS
jgi:hypothetical protein